MGHEENSTSMNLKEFRRERVEWIKLGEKKLQ
jgi:hypothetical protein